MNSYSTPLQKSAYSQSLPERLNLLRGVVDRELAAFVKEIDDGCPGRLRDSIAFSLLAPGKRLRPILALLAAEAVSGNYEAAIRPACALECIHCYSLIHDDLPAMDDDDLRRGRPTNHIQFDEATAILAGDALQPLAFEILAKSIPDSSQAIQAVIILAESAGPAALVGGQMDDLLAETRAANQDFDVEWIHLRKTAAMIRASVEIGGLVGNATTQELIALRTYGQAIGLAFQIVDDCLDEQASPEQIGKSSGKDLRAGKITYPAVYGIEHSKTMANEFIANAVKALSIFGTKAQPLIDLANFVVERSH